MEAKQSRDLPFHEQEQYYPQDNPRYTKDTRYSLY